MSTMVVKNMTLRQGDLSVKSIRQFWYFKSSILLGILLILASSSLILRVKLHNMKQLVET